MSDLPRDPPPKSAYFEAGRAAALRGDGWPPRPGHHTPWKDWQFWHGYQEGEAERIHANLST